MTKSTYSLHHYFQIGEKGFKNHGVGKNWKAEFPLVYFVSGVHFN